MVDSKKIGIAGAAVVLVTLVTIFGTSYMADFENNPRNVAQNNSQENELEAIEHAVQELKVHSDAFAALRMNRHIDHALKGTKLEDWSNSN